MLWLPSDAAGNASKRMRACSRATHLHTIAGGCRHASAADCRVRTCPEIAEVQRSGQQTACTTCVSAVPQCSVVIGCLTHSAPRAWHSSGTLPDAGLQTSRLVTVTPPTPLRNGQTVQPATSLQTVSRQLWVMARCLQMHHVQGGRGLIDSPEPHSTMTRLVVQPCQCCNAEQAANHAVLRLLLCPGKCPCPPPLSSALSGDRNSVADLRLPIHASFAAKQPSKLSRRRRLCCRVLTNIRRAALQSEFPQPRHA